MMRCPGSSVAPCAARKDSTKAAVDGRVLGGRPSHDRFTVLRHGNGDGEGSRPGTSSPKTTPRWQMLPASTGSMSSKEMSRSTSSRAGASPPTVGAAVVRRPAPPLDLDRRAAPAGQLDRGPVGGDTPVEQVADDGSSRPKCCWMAGVLKPIFQPTRWRRRPARRRGGQLDSHARATAADDRGRHAAEVSLSGARRRSVALARRRDAARVRRTGAGLPAEPQRDARRKSATRVPGRA